LVDFEKIYEDFAVKTVKGSNDENKSPKIKIKPKKITYLDQKTAQNLGIFLAGFKFRKEELVKKISIVSVKDGGLLSGQIENLIKFCPEPDLKTLYDKHISEPKVLTREDLFMMQLCSIPKLSMRLDILKQLHELPQQMEALLPEMETLLSACEQLLTSKLFDEFLAYFKAITNLINSHNSKGTTEGISLSCLSQTFAMRTNDRKRSLLQVLISVIKEKAPHILQLPNDLKSVSRAKSYSTKGLHAEVDGK